MARNGASPQMSVALSSWKEIAAYLGKGVRTVQRWELQFGLPVRRPNAKSHVIFAVPSELDAWVKSHQHAPNNHGGKALASNKNQRTQQRQLLDRKYELLRRLEKNEQVLGRNITRLRDITQSLGTFQEAPNKTRSQAGSNNGGQKTRSTDTAA